MNNAKSDSNQKQIVNALRKAGAKVESLHRVGKGVPDLLVAYRGRWFLIEIKRPGEELGESQIKWHSEFGEIAPIHIVRNEKQALEVIFGRTV